MLTILKLFGRSPFAPLASHMENVAKCVYLLNDVFDALEKQDHEALEKFATQIHDLENQADLTKNDIRNHLPKSIFLPIDRGNLLDILKIQDTIADRSEDIAVLVTLKQIKMPESFKEDFREFLKKNIETFNGARGIIKELHELLESSFAGVEAAKVRSMVEEVAFKENEVDIIQKKLLKKLIQAEDEMTYTTFYLWQRIFEAVGSLSDLSENLANRVRTMLDLK